MFICQSNLNHAEKQMAKFHDSITNQIQEFIEKQHMFFVASAPLTAEGHVNLSPKGLDCFRVLYPNKVGYMDLISSGNETSAHLHENGRLTIMMCSFEGNPNILRLYGNGYTVLPDTPEWDDLSPQFTIYPSTRQLIVMDVTKVQTSCGFGVPLFDYVGERDIHFEWAEKKGEDGLKEYRTEKNHISLDGLPTPLGIRDGKLFDG
jgi:hypothetical protein